MSWLAGLTAGVSEGISDAHERRRQRIEQQMEEARKLASVAKTRSSKAKEVSQKIGQAHARFGVSKETLFSAYKAGQLETLLGLYDSPDMTTAMREALWKVPESQVSLNAGESIYDQINRAMGAISMGVKSIPEDQRNDYNVGSLLSRMMGGYTPDSINLALDDQTVEGFDVNELLNMPEPEALTPDQGANFNYDVIKQAELAGKLRGRSVTGDGSKEEGPSFRDITPAGKRRSDALIPLLVEKRVEELEVSGIDVIPSMRARIEAQIEYDVLEEIARRENAAADKRTGNVIYPEIQDFDTSRYSASTITGEAESNPPLDVEETIVYEGKTYIVVEGTATDPVILKDPITERQYRVKKKENE
jgi:hypothetical protein